LSLWGRLLYFFSKDKKYIAAMPIGYKTNLVMFFQISRTLQRKQHAKWTSEVLEYRRWCARFTIDDTLITQPQAEASLRAP
jgi:hypothetical protein